MRQLKPSTILLLGASLTGAAMTAAFLSITRDVRNPRGFSIVFSVGAGFGLLMFSPVAFAERFRYGIRRWLERHGRHVQPGVSFLMAMALGYWIASMRHGMFDALSFVAMGFVFIGALFGIVVGIVNSERRSGT
jgi:hypothetical protein